MQDMESVVKSEYSSVEIKVEPILPVDFVDECADNKRYITDIKTEPSDFSSGAVNPANIDWEDASEIVQAEDRNDIDASSGAQTIEITDKFDKAFASESVYGAPSREKSLSCDTCNKVFSSKNSLRKHKTIHTGAFTCDVCQKTFSRKEHLKVHYRLHTGDKPFSCNICGKSFSRGSSLKIHLVVHTGVKSYSCDICGNSFALRSSLRKHILVHMGEKPFTCVVCMKTFSRSGHLKQHKVTHLNETLSCRVCGKIFIRHRNLQKHSSSCWKTEVFS